MENNIDNNMENNIENNVDNNGSENNKNDNGKGNIFKRLARNKSLRYGSVSFVLIAIVVAIAVFVNMIVGMLDIKWDLTPNKLYSITDTTKEILNGLQTDVTIYGLFDPDKAPDTQQQAEYQEVVDLLDQYKKYSHVKIVYKDPNKNPGLIKEIDDTGSKQLQKDDFVVKSGNKIKVVNYSEMFAFDTSQGTMGTQKLGSKAEQAITGAIKYVTSEKTPKVYFTVGHDEPPVDKSFTIAQQYMERNNFEIQPLNLLTEEKVPDDAEIIVFLSPKKDMTTVETEKLRDYFHNGGKGMFLFDPVATGVKFTQFNSILSEYNLSLNHDKVKENDDTMHLKNDPYTIVLNSALVMPNCTSINILKNKKEYVNTTTMLQSSGKSVGELFDKSEGADLEGPLDLAVAVENKGFAGTSKIIVFGNSTFMSDGVTQGFGEFGVSYFLYALSWMQDKQDDLDIQAKNYVQQALQMTSRQADVAAWITLVFFPLIILGFGGFVWFRRRHL